ncbi:MAG: NADH:flavin oxidoreductase/NADH oxidase [Micropruina sp.]|nr:NADH:flavin oxidoreductase/NADH oxidase [Micropruina sp.]
MTSLFEPLTLAGTTFRNRVWWSPVCQYSCLAGDGVPNNWHLTHLGSRAVGGFGLVMTEASAVLPEGRISPQDAGMWNEAQQQGWARIVAFGHQQGAAMGIQLAHAGRKASTYRAFPGELKGPVPHSEGGWETVGPSPVAYPRMPQPRELDAAGIRQVIDAFRVAAQRADQAGFDVVEIHSAHGYLLHQFLSPLSNHRGDAYGGDVDGRTRLLIEVVDAVRDVWPVSKALFVRISATDWAEGGWTVDDSVRLASILKHHGVQLIDVSSGGNVTPTGVVPGPGYLVPYAQRIRSAGIAVGAVGFITDPIHADGIIANGDVDAIMVGRAALRDPYWPQRAATQLGVTASLQPAQYHRAAW